MKRYGTSKDMKQPVVMRKSDILRERFGDNSILAKARKLLEADDQTEEGFLGAQTVFLIHGLL